MNLNKIVNEINQVDFWKDGSGADMCIRPCELPKWLAKMSETMKAIQELEGETGKKAKYVMINRLGPKICIPIHTDVLLDNEKLDRYHLPVETNRYCRWWDEEGGWIHFPLGVWWGPVKYWIRHSVENLGDRLRTHIVVDLI